MGRGLKAPTSMSSIEVSFITALYNCLDYTQAYFRTLKETVNGIQYEVILIDDYSTDGTREYLMSLPTPPCRIFLNDENRGFAHNNNLGAKVAQGKYLCLLNNDLVLKSGWFKPMLELLTEEPDVGVVGNIQINANTKLIDHAGVFFDLRGHPAHAWKNRRRRPPRTYGEWNAVTGACMLITAEVFQKIGGFDEAYRNSFEDIDLCVRLRKAGYRVLVSHQSEVEHYVGTSPGRHKHDEKNIQIFLNKWQNVAADWGRNEWPRQYFHCYARYWWKMKPLRVVLALWLMLTGLFLGRTNGNSSR